MDRAQTDPLPTATQPHPGPAPGAGAGRLGAARVAERRRGHGYGDGLADDGHARAAVPGDLGGHDGGDDVPDRRPHDPHLPSGAGGQAHSAARPSSRPGCSWPAYMLVWTLVGRRRLCGRPRRRGRRRAARYRPPRSPRDRRGRARRGRPLPAHAVEGSVPVAMPHADQLHHDLVARRGGGRAAHGPARTAAIALAAAGCCSLSCSRSAS